MILFNWFCVALIPILMLIVERMRGMAHRTPILRYCVIGVAGAAPITFLTATIFWLLAAFRPHRAPSLTQLYNDLAWITFTCGVPFLVALCLFLAVAIYLDEQTRPVFARWVGHFNLVIAIALVPAGFAGLTLTGPFAWNGFLSFWVKNLAIALWLVVMAVVLAQSIGRDQPAQQPRHEAARAARRSEAGTVAGLVRHHRLLLPVHRRLLHHHADPAAGKALGHPEPGRRMVRQPPRGSASSALG